MSTTYRRTTRIDATPERVFQWHERPGAFERLAPPWAAVQIVKRTGAPLEPGSRLELGAKVGPLWRRWVAEHGDWVPGTMFSDAQVEGPFGAWEHTHRFDDDEGQTRLEDHLRYELPFGVLGPLGAGYAKGELDRMFSYRHRVTTGDIRFHTKYGREAMNVLISGSSGLIGSALTSFLGGGGHQVRRLLRTGSTAPNTATWNPMDGTFADGAFEGIDAVVHLAGAGIGDKRWSAARKQEIRDSRVIGTRRLAEALARLESPPRVLVAASALGFYGDRGDEVLDETAAPGHGFLPEVCQEWESAADPARERGIRVVHVRSGIVLSATGGALRQMLPPFKLGVGGVLGSGNQYMSWIALDDMLGILLHALTDESMSGPVNAVAPRAVTNREFTRTLGKVLRRPTVFPAPAFALRLLFGELAGPLLLGGARVDPAVLRASGFEYAYPDLEAALRHVLGRS